MFDFVKKMKDAVDRLLADPVQEEVVFLGPVIKMTTPKVVTSPELFDTSAKELKLFGEEVGNMPVQMSHLLSDDLTNKQHYGFDVPTTSDSLLPAPGAMVT